MAHSLFVTKDVWSQTAEGFGLGYPNWIPARSEDPTVFQSGVSVTYDTAAPSTYANTNSYIHNVMLLRKSTPGPVLSVMTLKDPTGTPQGIIAESDNPDGGGTICWLNKTFENKWTMYGAEIAPDGSLKQLPAIANNRRSTAPYNLLPMYAAMVFALETMVDPSQIHPEIAAAITCDLTKPEGQLPWSESVIRIGQAVYVYFSKSGFLDAFPGGVMPIFRSPSQDVVIEPLFGSCRFVTDGGNSVSAAARVRTPKTFGEALPLFEEWRHAVSAKWTPEERELIPTFPEDYPLVPEALKIAKRYVNTRSPKIKRKMNNFLWRGITSYGKSTGVEMVAALLDTPLVRMTCSSTMETQNFLSEFVPNNDPPIELSELPSIEQMTMDPEGAWSALTGEEREGVTADDCLKELIRRSAGNGGDGARFKHIESNYVKALARGYICEVQEISRVRDPGVLVGLNEYDRPGAIVPLANGGHVRRDPNAMVVYTDNVGYVSCRPVDPSVIRRMAFCIDSYAMSKETVIARVKYNTGFENQDLLNRMYISWRKIQDYCGEHEITEGSVSVTELEMWAICVDLEGGDAQTAYDTVRECVVSKATSVIAEQDEIMSACVDMALYN